MHRREKVTTNQVGIFRRVKKEIKRRRLRIWRFIVVVGYDHLTLVLFEVMILGTIFYQMNKDLKNR